MLKREDYYLAAALAAMALIGAWLRHAPLVCGTTHDDAIYVILGKALAAGKGYALIDLPGAPLQAKYPIGYPAILAAMWKLFPVFPANLEAFQFISAAAAALWCAVSYLYLVRFRYVDRVCALAAAGVCATAPYIAYLGSLTLSDMPFALVMVVALWCAESLLEGNGGSDRGRWWRELACGALFGVSFLFRVIGLSLIAVAVLFFRKYSGKLRCAAAVAVVVIPWLTWTAFCSLNFRNHPVIGYYTNYTDWWVAHGLPQMVPVIVYNIAYACLSLGKLPIDGLWALFGDVTPTGVLAAQVLVGLSALAALLVSVRRNQLLPFTLMIYLAAVTIWPWPPARFLAPLLLFLYAFMFDSARQIALSLPFARKLRLPSLMLLAVVLIANSVLLLRYECLTAVTEMPYATFPHNNLVRWQSYDELNRWCVAHIPAGSSVASDIDSLLYLYTGIVSFRPFVTNPAVMFYGAGISALGDADQFARVLDEHAVAYVVCAAMPGQPEDEAWQRLIDEFSRRYADRLVRLYTGADGRFAVFHYTAAAH
jgi:4-amino-4-deoxy-L-arabinose transferase-like glycosyltransferase